MIIYNVRVFASQLGWRLGALFFMLLLAGTAEGLGISLILPLLQSDIQESNDTLSKLIVWMFGVLNLLPTVANILVMLVIFFMFRALMLIAQSWYQAIVLSNHVTEMRSDLIRLVLNARYKHLSSYPSGYLTNAIHGEVNHVGNGMRSLIDLVVSLVTVSVYIALPLLLQPAVTVMLLVLAVPIGILSAFLIRKTKSASIKLTEQHGQQESFLIEGLRSAKFVKATGRLQTIIDRLVEVTTKVGLSYRRLMVLSSLTRYAPEPLVVVVMSGIIFFYTNVYDEPITEIMFLMFLFYQASKNMLRTQSILRTFIESSGSLMIHQKLRTDLTEHAVPDDSSKPQADIESDISLDGITVQFPDQDKPALNNISILIRQHQTVALVGPSGSGKTTIANLICGLIEPSSGSLSVGDKPYSSISISKLQKQIGYVTQESAIYNGTIGDNVTFWDENPDIGKLAALLKQVELDDITETNADPENRVVGGDGAQLSGGERQRLSIARELYRDSKLMILDEATSALDSELEAKIDDLLVSEQGNKTFVIIAHRLATVQHADLIYVLDEGKVIETGNFDELVDANGEFAKMVKLQSF